MEKISKEATSVYPQYAANASLPNSVATLVLGILSVALCGIGLVLGIIAIVLGYKDKATYKSSPESYSTTSLANAKAGIICGIVGVSFNILFVLFYVSMFALAFMPFFFLER